MGHIARKRVGKMESKNNGLKILYKLYIIGAEVRQNLYMLLKLSLRIIEPYT